MSRIVFQNVRKSFPQSAGQQWLKSYLQKFGQEKNGRFEALRGVTFSIDEGQSIALIGRNGAGKSTVLNLIAGLLVPNAGTLQVEGRVAAVLDLGAGFHGDLTGRENLVINAALMGLSRSEVKRHTAGIIEFSGLGDFIEQPVRTYSAGMTMRLAFSVATCVDPDILLIDEVLSVGDAAFQAKCFDRIRLLKSSGKIFLCASHGAEVERLCESAIWIEQGNLRMAGPIANVMAAYTASLTDDVDICPEHGHPGIAPAPSTASSSDFRKVPK